MTERAPYDGMPIQVSPELALEVRRGRERPMAFPMELLRPHEAQALANHYQSLDKLASRGGCSPAELVAILEDRPWRSMRERRALERLTEILETSLSAKEE